MYRTASALENVKKTRFSDIAEVLAQTHLDSALDLRVASIVHQMQQSGNAEAGLGFMLGYSPGLADYFSRMAQPAMPGLEVNLPVNIATTPEEELLTRLAPLGNPEGPHDGFAIIDDYGVMHNAGLYVFVNPRVTYDALGIERPDAASLGFRSPIGARHTTALAASYQLGVRVYTVSAQNQVMRIFVEGKIAYSTEPSEMNYEPRVTLQPEDVQLALAAGLIPG